MKRDKIYDCAVIGGGLAGLCLSIQLAKKGHSVVLLEKSKYPFHKVCGEYISMESWSFLEKLGLPLSEMNLPKINSLSVSEQNGFKIGSELKMGGFGISRLTLDYELFSLAKKNGVLVLENCKATGVALTNMLYKIESTSGQLFAKLVCGSYGKLEPTFMATGPKNTVGNYIAVKYHVKINFPDNLIELHNFKDGYCGISKVDNENYCICYLTTTKNLRDNKNDIKALEQNVLMQNPYLKKYFTEAKFMFEKPLVISQIGFNKKSTYKKDVILLGDAAGAIAPLCGNGMSLAMRSSKLLAKYVSGYINGNMSKIELVDFYTKAWNKNFSIRIRVGYYLQKLFGKKATTWISLKILSFSPRLFRKLITWTHGNVY